MSVDAMSLAVFFTTEIVAACVLVTVLLDAVSAVNVFTSHKKIARSNPADATCSRSLAYAKALT